MSWLTGIIILLGAPLIPVLLWPPLALAPALLFVFFAMRVREARPWLAWCAAGAWVVYTICELRMHAWTETVSVPIRVDLVAIVPALWIVTTLGILSLRKARRRAPRRAMLEVFD